ncbi:MAG: TetR/AcrR family transcriptional repressor of mexJK operon [Glaciecola sp.]|jgi:TetR/AcrR family transcriptional repressor of mexJK operon
MSRRDAEGRILAAARDLFLEFGVASVTTDKLAKAAKTSKMTLYKYFASKEELLEAVVEKEVAKIYEPSKMEVNNQLEYQNMLKLFCVNLVNILFDPQIVRFDQLMISQALSSRTMSQDHYKRCYLPAIKELVRLITMGQNKQYLKTTQDPEDIADMVLSSISGLSYTKALFGFDINTDKLEEKIANVLDILFSADDNHKQSKA